MSTAKQYAVVLWHEVNQISTILLDVMPYQHRIVGAETDIGGHKVKILAICDENESTNVMEALHSFMSTNDLQTNNKMTNEAEIGNDTNITARKKGSSPSKINITKSTVIQMMDKEVLKQFCKNLGVTREKVQFLEKMCQLFNECLKDEENNEMQQASENIVEITAEFLTADDNRTELYHGCGFFLPSPFFNLVHLTYGPDYTNWRGFVREVLQQIYKDKMMNYTARGSRGGPSIEPKLLDGLLKKVNEHRSRENKIHEKEFIRYINHTIGNKRYYLSSKGMEKTAKSKKNSE